MKLEVAQVAAQTELHGGYRVLVLRAPAIAPEVQPGQFVHLQVPAPTGSGGAGLTLRRPFSVYRAENEALHLLYKEVGCGTHAMTRLAAGDRVSLMGPLGRPFPPVQPGRLPVLVAGGYGMAALYLVAARSPARGLAFVGGKGAQDILCVAEFESLGWDVRVATEDGTQGVRGLVTELLDAWAAGEGREQRPELFACGPMGMLKAVGERAGSAGWTAWLSLDRHMGCGVGACLTCVQKVKSNGGWNWARVCKEGPVFAAKDIVWEEGENG